MREAERRIKSKREVEDVRDVKLSIKEIGNEIEEKIKNFKKISEGIVPKVMGEETKATTNYKKAYVIAENIAISLSKSPKALDKIVA